MTETQKYLKENPNPQFDAQWWAMADEIILFFQQLKSLPQYAKIKVQKDAPLYDTCINVAAKEDIDVVDFNFAVMMPHLYCKLNPKEPIRLNPLTSEAKLYAESQFLGQIGNPERFFMKLMKVETEDRGAGGNLFVLQDRSGNTGLFYDKAERWDQCVQLGHCFHFHAIPQRHTNVGDDNQPVTLFRNVEFVETAGPSTSLPPVEHDKTGLFVKGR
jgi:hypothetical protein